MKLPKLPFKFGHFYAVLLVALAGLSVVMMCLYNPVLAAAGNYGLSKAAQGTGLNTTADIPTIIARVIQTALSLVGTIFFVLMLYAGFLWMTARGNEKQAEKAKEIIFGAIIGIIIVTLAYAITSTIIAGVTGAGNQNAPTNQNING